MIRDNKENVEENKMYGKDILKAIEYSSFLPANDKMTIKSQLLFLVY
ncbi:MAG: hypothetical protein U9Q66_04515 [Patescibacteria group bacterium]|nr:hypothetical protein [Patescibacteria group bacterium]